MTTKSIRGGEFFGFFEIFSFDFKNFFAKFSKMHFFLLNFNNYFTIFNTYWKIFIMF